MVEEERMIPGSVSKLSEATVASASTITAKADIVHVTGSTIINTIIPGLGTAVSQFLVLQSAVGISLGTSGNILQGIAIAQNRPVFLVWSKTLQKWLINSGA
jgi:hypothetical protein